jgi:hypothetical protein
MNQFMIPSHYSERAHSKNWFLRSWILEGSIDGSSWILLDEQKYSSTMNSTHPIGTFAVGHSVEYRFIRICQTGKNARGSDWLILFGFEVFGQFLTSGHVRSHRSSVVDAPG